MYMVCFKRRLRVEGVFLDIRLKQFLLEKCVVAQLRHWGPGFTVTPENTHQQAFVMQNKILLIDCPNTTIPDCVP